ncbi:biotin biosynthesis protein BioC [Rhizobium sp. Leaf384]|uniref:hypothetical protein n=1 Tax=unclassified Rhizobium TaxID=2613769 RepID=UPI0007149D21|nr:MULTISPECIES: hypothetical protein [unclassified Rhizobium]KQR68049.1 biotin biosynthesis protein BioC [Rhizobium sp. Leaf341]KQS74419.1 biotin biosynthesis protein BioC [Rhizobium sp. Leaf383]KQS81438.1 biotin biosynthesis protein BioC [Rhizobium sp. Leaf384]
MQIAGKTIIATNDAGQRAPRSPVRPDVENREPTTPVVSIGGSYDPSSRVSLSAETLLFLSRTKRAQEKYPPLTREEWNNKLSPQLAAREYQAFGKYGETGDYKAYYRGFIDYYDNLRPDDQDSLRYFGTRDAAVAGLRSAEYEDESGLEAPGGFQTLVDVLLDGEKPSFSEQGTEAPAVMITGDKFGWDTGSVSYEDVTESRAEHSEIERFYRESF